MVGGYLIKNRRYGFEDMDIIRKNYVKGSCFFLQASLYSAGIFTKNFLVVNRKIIFCGEMVQVFVWCEMYKSRKFLLPETTILEEKNE